MHTVIDAHCTGCELCIPVCPVDCISLEDATPGRTGWQAWSPAQAAHARARYALHGQHRPTDARQGKKRPEAEVEAPSAEARKRSVVEAALARAQAAEGLIPESAAHSIVGSCKVELFDVAKIVRESGRAGSVAIPLVKALREAVGLFNAEAAPFVHFGSTSQDVIDSAMSLVTREAVALIETDLAKAAEALLQLSLIHI